LTLRGLVLLGWPQRRSAAAPQRRRAALGERLATLAWREGMRRWRAGRDVGDQFIPF